MEERGESGEGRRREERGERGALKKEVDTDLHLLIKSHMFTKKLHT